MIAVSLHSRNALILGVALLVASLYGCAQKTNVQDNSLKPEEDDIKTNATFVFDELSDNTQMQAIRYALTLNYLDSLSLDYAGDEPINRILSRSIKLAHIDTQVLRKVRSLLFEQFTNGEDHVMPLIQFLDIAAGIRIDYEFNLSSNELSEKSWPYKVNVSGDSMELLRRDRINNEALWLPREIDYSGLEAKYSLRRLDLYGSLLSSDSVDGMSLCINSNYDLGEWWH